MTWNCVHLAMLLAVRMAELVAEWAGLIDPKRALLKAKLGAKIEACMPQTFTFLNQDCASLVSRVLNRLHPR